MVRKKAIATKKDTILRYLNQRVNTLVTANQEKGDRIRFLSGRVVKLERKWDTLWNVVAGIFIAAWFVLSLWTTANIYNHNTPKWDFGTIVLGVVMYAVVFGVGTLLILGLANLLRVKKMRMFCDTGRDC